MIGTRPDDPISFHVSEIAGKYGASVATETSSGDAAYADWPGDYEPVRLPWPTSE
jgi:hypothetical protein